MKRSPQIRRALGAALAAGATCLVGGHAFAQSATADTGETPMAHNGLGINGAVGLPLNPTANIPNNGGIRIQADYYDLGDLKVDNEFGFGFDRSQKIGDARYYGVHGAGAIGKRWELNGGIDYLRLRGEKNIGFFVDSFDFDSTDGIGFSIGTKYQAWHSEDGSAAIAVGAGYSSSLFRNVNAYVVGSKAFGTGQRVINGHLGVRFTVKGVDGYVVGGTPHSIRFDDSSRKVSVFAGAEVPIDKEGRFTLVG
jgi:hypothetical protein